MGGQQAAAPEPNKPNQQNPKSLRTWTPAMDIRRPAPGGSGTARLINPYSPCQSGLQRQQTTQPCRADVCSPAKLSKAPSIFYVPHDACWASRSSTFIPFPGPGNGFKSSPPRCQLNQVHKKTPQLLPPVSKPTGSTSCLCSLLPFRYVVSPTPRVQPPRRAPHSTLAWCPTAAGCYLASSPHQWPLQLCGKTASGL